jgi:hypothetical protein
MPLPALSSYPAAADALASAHLYGAHRRAIIGAATAAGSNPIGDMLSSPMAKAVLAGIAAMVVKRMMGSSPTT